jgi:hypothetical protein
MPSGSKRVKSLRALFAQIPGDDEILEILLELSEQADRTAAIVGGAILEDRLENTVIRYLSPRMTESEHHECLFSETFGPLSTFDAKTRAAYCLGIINETERNDIDNIRRIRNGFAHSIPHHAFGSAQIYNICVDFDIIKKTLLGPPMGIIGEPVIATSLRGN